MLDLIFVPSRFKSVRCWRAGVKALGDKSKFKEHRALRHGSDGKTPKREAGEILLLLPLPSLGPAEWEPGPGQGGHLWSWPTYGGVT